MKLEAMAGDCIPWHRHQEFILFLKRIDVQAPTVLGLHLIVSNYGTYKPLVESWLRRHERFQLHVTPSSSTGLNLIECRSRGITDKRIRRDSLRSTPDLIKAIEYYLDITIKTLRLLYGALLAKDLGKICKI
jgi:hypothetical protein